MTGWGSTSVLRRCLDGCKNHILAIILALLIGVIYVVPHVYFAHTPEYRGIYMGTAPDEDFYITAINKSYQSAGLIGDPFLFENSASRSSFRYFAVEFVLGKIGMILHMPIDVLSIVMKFVFPSLLTLVVYAFSLALSKNKITALLASAGVLLGQELAQSGVSYIIDTLLFSGQHWNGFLAYSRPVNPEVSALLFFGTLLSLWHMMRNPRSAVAVVTSGLLVGVTAYVYFFFWAFEITLLAVMTLFALASRKWDVFVATICAGTLSIVVSIFFLIGAISDFLHASGGVWMQSVPTHHYIVEKMTLLPLAIYGLIFLWAWREKKRGALDGWATQFTKKYLFILLLVITGVLVSNQQVLTGKLVQQFHFHFFTNLPLFVLAMSVVLCEVLALIPRAPRYIAIGGVFIVFFWFAAGVQVSSYTQAHSEYVRYEALAPIWTWLNTHGSKNSVVLGDDFTSTRVTMYTQDFSYSALFNSNFRVPEERIEHNYFVALMLRGVTANSVRSYVYQTDNRAEIGVLLFGGQYYRDLCGSYGCFPDSVLERLISDFKIFAATPLNQNITKYKAEYILLDSIADAKWNTVGILAGKPLVTSGDFRLFAIQH